mgnify:CR=1 FL=1
MNISRILQELKMRYPGKNIVQNDSASPTEIICEIDPTTDHPNYSVAVAIIDKSKLHYHRKLTETYAVLEGELIVKKDGISHHLKKGESFVISPGEVHEAKGNATWVKVTSRPGWSIEDHYLTSSP